MNIIRQASLLAIMSFSGFAAVAQCASGSPTKNGNDGTQSNSNDWAIASAWSPAGFPGTYDAVSDTYTIPAGLIVQVSASNFDLNSNLRVEGTLYVTGKLTVNAGKTVSVPTGGLITCCLTNEAAECGNSDKIDIGGYSWKGDSPGPFTGPAAISNSGMPISLGYFTAAPQEEQVNLRWSTILEQSFSRFEIQRSNDGVSYSVLGEVEGAGYDLTNIETHYSFNDVTPQIGWNYYRLNAIDYDGSQEFHGMQAVKIQGNEKLSLYPNPVNGAAIKVSVNFTPIEDARVRILNQMGVEVVSAPMPTFEKTLELDHALQPGVYTLQYTGAEKVHSVKFIVRP